MQYDDFNISVSRDLWPQYLSLPALLDSESLDVYTLSNNIIMNHENVRIMLKINNPRWNSTFFISNLSTIICCIEIYKMFTTIMTSKEFQTFYKLCWWFQKLKIHQNCKTKSHTHTKYYTIYFNCDVFSIRTLIDFVINEFAPEYRLWANTDQSTAFQSKIMTWRYC